MKTLLILLTLVSTYALGSWDEYKEDIVLAAHITGSDVALLSTVAYLESSYRKNVRAAKGTSKGIMGITDPTWNHLVNTYGHEYGILHTDRMNVMAELLMGAKYLQEIEEYMSSRLDRELSYLEIYMGYKFSPHRAVRMLKVDKTATLLAFYPDAATRNRPVYFSSDTPRSIMDVLNMFRGRINKAVELYSREAMYLSRVIKMSAFEPYRLAASNTECVYVEVPNPKRLGVGSPYDLCNDSHRPQSFDVAVSGRKHKDFFV